MKVSQKRKDTIQAIIEENLSILREIVIIRDMERTDSPMTLNGAEFNNIIKNAIKIIKALRRKYWGFTEKQILKLMKLENLR